MTIESLFKQLKERGYEVNLDPITLNRSYKVITIQGKGNLWGGINIYADTSIKLSMQLVTGSMGGGFEANYYFRMGTRDILPDSNFKNKGFEEHLRGKQNVFKDKLFADLIKIIGPNTLKFFEEMKS